MRTQLWIIIKQIHNILNILSAGTNTFFTRGYDAYINSVTQKLLPLLFALNRSTFFGYQQLIDIAVYDRPGKSLRFTILYNLLSTKYNNRLVMTIQVDELTDVPSLTQLYPSAGWLERECWDLFGIFFTNHRDLRRILTDYGFSGFPLRKDFPLTGFMEVFYNDEQKRVVYQPVELSQEMRQFNYQSPWEDVIK